MPTACGWPRRRTRPADLGIPFVFFVASSGADVLDGVAALHGWGRAAAAISRCTGQVPVIAAATGPVVSGPALLLGLSDLVVMSSEAVAFVSGPQMVAEFTGIEIGINELGGTATHATSSGLCAVESDDVEGAVAELLEYLPSSTDEVPPLAPVSDSVLRSTPELRTVIPDRKAATYDAREVVRSLCDDGEFRELWPGGPGRSSRPSPGWAACRSASWPINPGSWRARSISPRRRRPLASCGSATPSTCPSSAWWTRLASSREGPRVAGHDPPRRRAGLRVRPGDRAALCLILRKAFGGAYIVMDSRGIGNDVCLAWPGAEVAVMGASGAVQILHRGIEPGERADREAPYEDAYLNPWPASERGLVDEVIDPADSRIVLCSVLRQLCTKREFGGRPEA